MVQGMMGPFSTSSSSSRSFVFVSFSSSSSQRDEVSFVGGRVFKRFDFHLKSILSTRNGGREGNGNLFGINNRITGNQNEKRTIFRLVLPLPPKGIGSFAKGAGLERTAEKSLKTCFKKKVVAIVSAMVRTFP